MCVAAFWKFVTCCLLVGCLLPHVTNAKPPSHRAHGPPPPPKPPACASERSCILTASTEPICRYDDDEGCIRKYPSKCHLDIASCKAGKEYMDVSNVYCSMDTYLCEEGYERWTIFFGYEKI